MKRYFSSLSRTKRYALKEHTRTLEKRKLMK